jgi:hypothetical protein
MDAHGEDLYPDVTASGGLASAMREVARLRGLDIGLAPWAHGVIGIETPRGYLAVGMATEERLFRLGVHIPDFRWEIGATGDLGLLVEAVAAWREGLPFDVLAARFPFMDLNELAGDLARGEPAASQWSALLSTEYYRRQWDLLRRLHSDGVLRRMFPTVSHGAVRLRVEALDAAGRQVLVHQDDGGRHEVRRVGVPEDVWTEVPTGDLIAYLRAALTEE